MIFNGISKSILLFFVICFIENGGRNSMVEGHGMLLDPVGRASRWRQDYTAPANYDDNGVNCGGYGQMIGGDSNCGLCGDSYGDSPPRAHELGGRFGQGVIVKEYSDKSIWIGAKLTANHLGFWVVDLCNLDKFGSESEKCFAEHGVLKLDNGSNKFDVGPYTGWRNASALIPNGVHCNHCVLRWKYVSGNNWSTCSDGVSRLGCGSQETFVSCADIKIY